MAGKSSGFLSLHIPQHLSLWRNWIFWALAIIGAVVVIAGIAYAVYRYLTPDYLEDFDDDFDDDFEDEDLDEEKDSVREEAKEAAPEAEDAQASEA